MSREKKFNYLYKTTNLINGKYYIGVHSTNNLKDGYIGCGVRSDAYAKSSKRYGLKSAFIDAVIKYGYKNFKTEILKMYASKQEALDEECVVVNREFIDRKDNYNISLGGSAGGVYGTTLETDNLIFKDFMSGMRKKEICLKYGISPTVIFRITRNRDTTNRVKPIQHRSIFIANWISTHKEYFIDKYKKWELSVVEIEKEVPFDLYKNNFLKGVIRYKRFSCITPEGIEYDFDTALEISNILGTKIHHSGFYPVVTGKYSQYKGFKFCYNLKHTNNGIK